MQQRYYDPGIGRFLSVDPVSAVSFNRYWYGNGNPYKFVDPDGRRACGKSTTCALSQGSAGGVAYQNGARSERADTPATARIGERAANAANKALKSIANKRYKSEGRAAREWSDRVQIISEKYNTEIASLLFRDGDNIVLGSATSDGWIHKVDPLNSVAPDGLIITAGYVHSHPGNTMFSQHDKVLALDLYREWNGWVSNGQFNQTVFVSRPDGRVFSWSASNYMNGDTKSFEDPEGYDEEF